MNPDAEHHFLLLLGASNVGLAGLHRWVELLQPIFSALVSLGQVVVAVVTAIYVIRKIKLLKKNPPPNEKDSVDGSPDV
jgi:uncharacterized membrane protein YuzA (DUF378 family)